MKKTFTLQMLLIFVSSSSLIAQTCNSLYGVTWSGGIDDRGVIFHLNPNTGIQTVDYSISAMNKQGELPVSDLADGGNGKFYGMTSYGGVNGFGVIFEWDPLTNIYTKKIDFDGENGRKPVSSLTLYNGKFYGMTLIGGANNTGVFFEWDPVTNLYIKKLDFDGSNGSYPSGSLTIIDGKLYGMTRYGGAYGDGIIFEWDPETNIYTKKIDFVGTDGGSPFGSLAFNKGKLYGLAFIAPTENAQNGGGIIFEWDPVTNIYIKKIGFDSINGNRPYGSLTLCNEKFYGMATGGGANGVGVIFEWDPVTNIYTKKIDFDGTNGAGPSGSMTLREGKLYGMTEYGGIYGYSGGGVIFEWDPVTNNYTKKIDFNWNNGRNPGGSLILNNGKFFGMTSNGGANNSGVIFEWDPATNACTTKIDMNASPNGAYPTALTLCDEKFYGMTAEGGENHIGVIFEFDPITNSYTKKIDFDCSSEGCHPLGALTLKDRMFYGMTQSGGANNCGVIFEWDPATNIYTKKMDFDGTSRGSYPHGSLSQNAGKFYGTTMGGGAYDCGVIFEWDPVTNIYTKKIDFDGTTKGSGPQGSMTQQNGKLYGMTNYGGTYNLGVIFEWDPATNIYTKKIDFDGANGKEPQGSLTLSNGKFYGMTAQGGVNDAGIIFEWDPATNSYNKKIDFDGSLKGQLPFGSLTLNDGKFYGMTNMGGVNNMGVLFEWNPTDNHFSKLLDFDKSNGSYPGSTQLTTYSGTVEITNLTACNGYIWPVNGQTYTQSGTYSKVLTNSAGCDSIITLILTINNSSTSTTNISACNSYFWHDSTYTISGTYSVVFPGGSIMGCDSTAVLNLIVNPGPVPTITGPPVCLNSTVNVYSTEPGMNNYSWTEIGGAISDGGLLDSNTVTVIWSGSGPHSISVNYYNSNGCTAQFPIVYPVSVFTNSSPVTIAPVISAPSNSAILVPITVTGFDSISAMTLRLEYDPAVLAYTGYSDVNPILDKFMVNDIQISPYLHMVMMSWSDVVPMSLPNNSKLLDLNFTYLSGSGTTALAWNNTVNGGADCEYADATGEPLLDEPTSQFYINGEVNWQRVHQVSGILKYNNSVNTKLDILEIKLLNDMDTVNSDTSDENGYYELASIPDGAYTGQLNCNKPWQGVNATDALKVERHVVGMEPLTEPVRIQAADVNSSGTINSADALKIKRRVVGLDATFTKGDWTFAKPEIGSNTVIVNGANVVQDFYGLCVGDVNGSNIPGQGLKSADTYGLEYSGEIAAVPGSIIKLPVRIDRATDIAAITLKLQLPLGLFNVMGIDIVNDTTIFNQIDDVLNIAWTQINGINLQAGDTLLILNLFVNETSSATSVLPLKLMDWCEIADLTGNPIKDMTFIVPSFIQTVSINEMPFSDLCIYPNPATHKITISDNRFLSGETTVSIISSRGQQMIQGRFQNQKQYEMNVSTLAKGIYLVIIQTIAGVETKKLVIQ